MEKGKSKSEAIAPIEIDREGNIIIANEYINRVKSVCSLRRLSEHGKLAQIHIIISEYFNLVSFSVQQNGASLKDAKKIFEELEEFVNRE